MNGRIAAWKDALSVGSLGAPVASPDYKELQWVHDLVSMSSLPYDEQSGRVQAEAYHFYAAADYHRNYVLKRLLPSVGLLVA